jgi:hypothetical protein
MKHKDLQVSLNDYISGWDYIKYEGKLGSLPEVLAAAEKAGAPSVAQAYDEPIATLLLAILHELDRRREKESLGSFYAAQQPIAELLDCSAGAIGYWLRRFCKDGLLERVYRGHTGRASEYRIIDPQQDEPQADAEGDEADAA